MLKVVVCEVETQGAHATAEGLQPGLVLLLVQACLCQLLCPYLLLPAGQHMLSTAMHHSMHLLRNAHLES